MSDPISLTYFSDTLCVWANIAQARIDEVRRVFGDQVVIDYRFCSVFGDTQHKIGAGWADRGGFEGFAEHVQTAAGGFDHIRLSPDLWRSVKPASSTPSHLVLKAAALSAPEHCESLLIAIRRAFFEDARDIAQRAELEDIVGESGLSVDAVRAQLDSGAAFAALEADTRDKNALLIQGSPTFILDGGRQKLYGNVGYSVIEANIEELLRTPRDDAASWC